MENFILQFTRSVAVLPILAMGLTSPFVSPGVFQPSLGGTRAIQEEIKEKENDILVARAEKINAYFKARSMPLYGFGKKMAEEAEEHEIDWRLLPAIAVRESSGGKEACGYNPFGWASCKVSFKSFNESIEVLAKNLGGDNPNTANYYGMDSTREKLYYYNGTVIPKYPSEVLSIMEAIGK
ncbi:MAG: hypothetical protein WC878_01455 [Candidatus Paceibacterota bacterium]|jgi:hypothetical protein